MGLPTQPLALSAAYLAMLQPRQTVPHAAREAAAAPSAPAASDPATPPAPPFTGRGRLIDIIA